MTRKLILIAGMAFVLTGCGDKDGVDTSKPSMVNKSTDAVDTTRDATQGVADAVDDKTQDDATREAMEYMDREMEKIAESAGQ